MTENTVLYIVAALCLCAMVALVVVFRHQMRRVERDSIVIRPTDREDQWTAKTVVGRAVITRVHTDTNGWSYEIETDFRGEPTRLHYVAPSMAIARARIADLVTANLSTREPR